MLFRIGVAGLVAAMASSAQGQTKTITRPDWQQLPTAESLAEHYPQAGRMLDIEGYARVSCTVAASGALTDCKVDFEAPKDLGFGQAALAMSSEFRMRPQLVNGQPVDGGTVTVPIRFKLPTAEPLTLPPEPRSPEALEEGQRLVDAVGSVDLAMRKYDDEARLIETTAEGSASGAARAGAAGALRQAAQAHRQDLRDGYARALAAVFTEEEMSAITAFETSYGKLMQNPEQQAEAVKIAGAFQRTLRSTGHTAFCAKHDCGSPESIQRVWRPAEAKDGRIDNPQWAQVPDAADIASAGPAVVSLLGVTGAVRMTCRVAENGPLKDCAVDEETPAGMGFGRAALKLADNYRLGRVQLEAGGVGRKVTVRVGFPPPELGQPYRPPSAHSARALALARQIANQSGAGDTGRLQTELQIAGYESKPPPGADPLIYEDAIAAFRLGSSQGFSTSIDMFANAWAATFSEEQLAAFTAFYDSAAGKAQQRRNNALTVATAQVATAMEIKIAAEARTIYCATHDCTAPPGTQSANSARPKPSTRKP